MGRSTTGQKDANAIIQRSVAANQRDWEAVPKFDCWERDRTSEGTKTYQDIMILGTPYQRLVEINGKHLTATQAAE